MRFLPTLVFLLLAAVAATSATRADEKWIKISSEHFEIFIASHEYRSTQLIVRLEQFREFFFRAIPQGRIHDPKLQIFLFDTKEHFAHYLRESRNKNSDKTDHMPLGFPMHGRLQSRILLLDDGHSRLAGIHEYKYIHSLVITRFGKNVPLWFKNGLADVFANFLADGDIVTLGKPPPRRIRALGHPPPPIPLGTLFSVEPRSPIFRSGDETTQKFFAQSWLLLHFAMFGKGNEPFTLDNFLRFVDETSHPNADTAKAFEKAFASDYADLGKALNAYMRAGKYAKATATIPVKPIRDKITIQALTEEEREIELAGMAWRYTRTPEATATLEKLAKKYPNNPRVYEILAETEIRNDYNPPVWISMNPEPFDGANIYIPSTDRYLRKAIEKNTANAMVYVELLRYNDIKPETPGHLMSAKTSAKYTALVDRALELAPDCMEAYEMLAIIESQNPSMRIEKLNAVLEALPHMRERENTHYALATAYWRLKRHEDAQAAINELLNDPKSSHAMKNRARQLQGLIPRETGKK